MKKLFNALALTSFVTGGVALVTLAVESLDMPHEFNQADGKKVSGDGDNEKGLSVATYGLAAISVATGIAACRIGRDKRRFQPRPA